ncbi:hypothetical protein [Mangrovibacillus cuniculi]|uniref:Uncharacterized protein n=1 Tax=Mangrovibacillus cuniculi TaxID=2593652 RepID=A0A7S8C8Z6_9BACI|nr:hypothetical protein [Mangrovibacillus cuniculi]QPC45625.1 hypothetical protein G8O30_00845 [Mangrovibacillus cuniculi]
MKKLLLLMLLTLILTACGTTSTGSSQTPPSAEEPVKEVRAEVTEGDFIYRLVSEKNVYKEGEPWEFYAELEYVGELDEVEIGHAASPFYFDMVETTRGYQIGYPMDEPYIVTTLKRNEPYRENGYVGGGYSEHDSEEYVEFMKSLMNDEYPHGHYVINGATDFYLHDESVSEKQNVRLEAVVEFDVIK